MELLLKVYCNHKTPGNLGIDTIVKHYLHVSADTESFGDREIVSAIATKSLISFISNVTISISAPSSTEFE